MGRTLADARHDIGAPGDEVTLAVEGLSSPDFETVAFTARRGEILGISGLMGAGRTELAEAIFGLRPSSGQVIVNGVAVAPRSVAEMKRRNVAYVPEDRRINGMFLNRPVRENLSAAALVAFVRRAVRGIGFRGEREGARRVVTDMRISVPHVESGAGTLSGGNQQKVLLGRWLATAPDILILDEPTKGVDIGAKYDIHATIAALAQAGKTVILVPSDLPELLALSHRMLVMRKGRLVGDLPRADFDPVRIISLAAGDAEWGPDHA